MDKDEALKLALEALEFIPESGSMLGAHAEAKRLEAITAIKEALAQSDDLTIAYMAGFYDGKNKYAPQPKPEQEPVAWRSWNDKDKFGFWDTKAEAESWCDLDFDSEPLYTIPPPQREWVGLTEEEYKNIRYGSDESGPYVSYGEYDEGYECGSEIEIYVDDFAKAIEAKLREKNT